MSASLSSLVRLCAWLVCLACVAVCAGGAAWARQGGERAWAWQNPLPQGNAIYAVRFAADKLSGWAVGADGVILRTTDGGFRWEEQNPPVAVPLYGLYVRDARRAVAVGSRGLVLTTDDGGRRWVVRPTAKEKAGAKGAVALQEGAPHLFSVAFVPEGLHGWAVGSYGEVLRTEDGGRTWAAQRSGVRAHLYSVAFADAEHGVAAGATARRRRGFPSPRSPSRAARTRPSRWGWAASSTARPTAATRGRRPGR
jgi:photosystem II stability/assembly factor-like uncharacterized protein